MSKKNFSKMIVFLQIIVLLVLAIIIVRIVNKPIDYDLNLNTLPQFSFINSLNHNIYSDDSIQIDKSCLIISYNSDCEHCQYEVEQISKHIEQFRNYQVLMISFEPIENILAFREKYKLKQPFIIFLQDPKLQFDDIFGNSPIPTSFIYNKDKKLVKQFKGEVKTEALLKYLAE